MDLLAFLHLVAGVALGPGQSGRRATNAEVAGGVAVFLLSLISSLCGNMFGPS